MPYVVHEHTKNKGDSHLRKHENALCDHVFSVDFGFSYNFEDVRDSPHNVEEGARNAELYYQNAVGDWPAYVVVRIETEDELVQERGI